ELCDVLRGVAVASQADQVEPDDQAAVAVDHDVGRNVLHDAGTAADHGQATHTAELVHGNGTGDKGPICDGDEAAEQRVVGQDDVGADRAIVCDVGANHEQVVIADGRHAGFVQSAVNGD